MATAPTDPDFGASLDDFKRGGWIVSVLGGAGMLARLLLDDEHHPVMFYVRRILAGSIVGVVCYFALHGQDIDGIKKAIIMATSGAFSPELIEQLRKRYSKGLNEKPYRKKRRKSRKT